MNGRPLMKAVGGPQPGRLQPVLQGGRLLRERLDKQGVFPWAFVRRVSEGGYEFSQDYVYLQHRHQVKTQKEQTHEVPAHVQDMLSAFYYARTLDYANAEPGDEFAIQTFLDDELWPLRMKFIGRETIKLRNGKVPLHEVPAHRAGGRIFKTNDDLNVWVTDDGNRIPVLAKAKVLVVPSRWS